MKIPLNPNPVTHCSPADRTVVPSRNSAAVLTPDLQTKIEARLAEIERTLLAGFLSPEGERALLAEKSKLENLLLTAANGPSTTHVLSGDAEEKIRARLNEIDRTLLAGFVTPQLEHALLAEKAELESILRAA